MPKIPPPAFWRHGKITQLRRSRTAATHRTRAEWLSKCWNSPLLRGEGQFLEESIKFRWGGGQLLICLFHYLYMPALEVASYMGYSVFNEQHRELSNKSHVWWGWCHFRLPLSTPAIGVNQPTLDCASQRYTHHYQLLTKRNAEATANMEARVRKLICSRERHRVQTYG